MTTVFASAALLTLAALFGGMLAFSVMFAPLVFIRLPGQVAGSFIRQVFPWYYLWVLCLAALSSVTLALGDAPRWTVPLAALLAATAAWLRWGLMPSINQLRDLQMAGDRRAGRSFDRQHRLSVAVNLAQMLAAGALLVALGLPD